MRTLRIGVCLFLFTCGAFYSYSFFQAQAETPNDAATLVAAKTSAASWPQWRGPLRDGISTDTGLRKNWDGGLKLLWDASGYGKGYSGVSIQAGKIYSMGDHDGSEYILGANLDDGKVLWEVKVGKSSGNGGYPGPRCTPTLDGNMSYSLGSRGDLVCVNLDTHTEVWRKSFMKDFDGKMMSGWGYSESPLVDGEKLICTPGGKKNTIVALNKKNGDLIWSSQAPNFSEAGNDGAAYSSCVIANCAGVKQYVQLLGHGVVGVNAADGKFLWGYGQIAGRVANIPTPVVRGDYVFSTTGYDPGGAASLKIEKNADGGLTANEIYYKKPAEFRNHHGGMILIGDYIYGGDGQKLGFPTCIEFLTGKMTWTAGKKFRGPGEGSAAIAYADGKFYFRYEDGTLALIDGNPHEYHVISTFKLPSSGKPSWPHPVITDGKLYIRDQDHLYCYDLKNAP